MDLALMMEFFKWCSIINCIVFIIGVIAMPLSTKFYYDIHTKLNFFGGSKEDYKQANYKILGHWKILIMVFNIVPYFALKIMVG